MLRTATATAAPGLVFLCLLFSHTGADSRGKQAPPLTDEIPQPLGWVAFAADVSRTSPQGYRISGRFWRAADGSTREEYDLTGESSGVGAMIKNIGTSLLYTLLPDGTWVSQPMVLPQGRFQPLRRRHGSAFQLSESTVQGFVVYRASGSGGGIELQAPALNFFPLRREYADGGVDQYTNVRIGPPPPNVLFEPSPGASVTYLSEPGGLIWKRPKQR